MDLHFLVSQETGKGERLCAYSVTLASGTSFAQQPAPSEQAVGSFCFPLGQGEAELSREQSMRLKYTFTLMDSAGQPLHGFCRRASLPAPKRDAEPTPEGDEETAQEDPPTRAIVVLCLLAPAPLFHTFFRCLEILHHLLAADGYVASYTPLDDPAPPRELPAELPTDSQAAAFLAALRETLSGSLAAGAVVSVALPPRADYKLSPLPTIATDVPSQDGSELPPRLAAGEDFAELQVPPSATGEMTEAVVPLASLVYSLSPAVLATLFASLLMERRVILTSASFATLATAVHAAAALIRPFHWHNLFLPLLPAELLEALCSPTPFLVGLPAALRDAVDWAAMEDVVVVDLDASTIEPAIGADRSDSGILPGWQQLVAAFTTMQDNLRSPHEYRANATVSAIVQEFLAATIGGYREFIKSPAQQNPQRPVNAAARLQGGMNRLRSKLAATMQEARADGAGGAAPPPQPESSGFMDDQMIQGTGGYRFYHSQFVASFGSHASRQFAAALIHTQLWQAFISERMAMMQQPDAADDAFEMRVLQRQARNKSVGAVFSEGVQRVKDSSRTAALARWTSQKAAAAAALGKQAGAAMSAGIDRAWARIERSPSGTPEAHAGMGRPDRPPEEFFDEIDDAAKQSGGDVRPLRERFGLAAQPADSAASDATGAAAGASPPGGERSLMADLAEASSDEDIFADGDGGDPMSASPWDGRGKRPASKPSGVKLAARAAMELLTGSDMTGDVKGAPKGRAAAPPPREPDDEVDHVARAGLDLLEGKPLVAPGVHAEPRLPSTLQAGIDLVQGRELAEPAPQPLGQNADDTLHAGMALLDGTPLDPPEIAGHHEPDPTVAAARALIRGEPFDGEPAAAPGGGDEGATQEDAAAAPATPPAHGSDDAAAPEGDDVDAQPRDAPSASSGPAGRPADAAGLSAEGGAVPPTSGDAFTDGAKPEGAAGEGGETGADGLVSETAGGKGDSDEAAASPAAEPARLSVENPELQPVASCSADFLADADFEMLEAEHSGKHDAAGGEEGNSASGLEVQGVSGELKVAHGEGESSKLGAAGTSAA